jgi:hypothetical protein
MPAMVMTPSERYRSIMNVAWSVSSSRSRMFRHMTRFSWHTICAGEAWGSALTSPVTVLCIISMIMPASSPCPVTSPKPIQQPSSVLKTS